MSVIILTFIIYIITFINMIIIVLNIIMFIITIHNIRLIHLKGHNKTELRANH